MTGAVDRNQCTGCVATGAFSGATGNELKFSGTAGSEPKCSGATGSEPKFSAAGSEPKLSGATGSCPKYQNTINSSSYMVRFVSDFLPITDIEKEEDH